MLWGFFFHEEHLEIERSGYGGILTCLVDGTGHQHNIGLRRVESPQAPKTASAVLGRCADNALLVSKAELQQAGLPTRRSLRSQLSQENPSLFCRITVLSREAGIAGRDPV